MTTPETKTVFRVRIVYKSGYTHDAEFFKLKIANDKWEWEPVSSDIGPIIIGVDEVAAVWQLGTREVEVQGEE